MAIICRQYNLLFLMAPRTACTAVGKILFENLDGEWLPREDIFDSQRKLQIPRKHSNLEQLYKNKILSLEEKKTFLKFTTIRNPFDSLVSLYTKQKISYQPLLSDPNSWIYKIPGYVDTMKFCQNHSFDEWIVSKYKSGFKQQILGRGRKSLYGNYTEGVDLVMRFEEIQNDFQKVLKMANVPFSLSIPIFNETSERSSQSYRSYYTKKSRSIVEYAFRDELIQYKYSF